MIVIGSADENILKRLEAAIILISLLLTLAPIMPTTAAVFAVDDVGLSIGKDPTIVEPLVDDIGL